MAIADLKNNSPTQSQSQNVNIVVAPNYQEKQTQKENKEKETEPKQQTTEFENPYSGLNQTDILSTRDIEAAYKRTDEIAETIEEKENTIKALSLIIEIIQNNPLIIKQFVVAELETLTELIRLITNSDSVEIDTNDIECTCSKPQYRIVKRIYIKKDEEIYSAAQCPILLRLFDNYKISLNLVI